MTKDDYKPKMNQVLMNKDKFKIDETADNNRLTECSVSYKLQILLLHGYISESQYRSQWQLKRHTWEGRQKWINR